MWPLGDGGLQRLGQPRWCHARRYALLYIVPEQIRIWMPHPLEQAYQCLPLLTSQERQKGGRAEDLPDNGLSRSRQVVRQLLE